MIGEFSCISRSDLLLHRITTWMFVPVSSFVCRFDAEDSPRELASGVGWDDETGFERTERDRGIAGGGMGVDLIRDDAGRRVAIARMARRATTEEADGNSCLPDLGPFLARVKRCSTTRSHT